MTVPPILRAAFVPRPPEEAFAIFTDRMGSWWPLVSHGVFGTGSGGVAVENGRVIERAVDGRTAVWAEVLAWEPPGRLVLAWHAGRDAGPAGRVEVRFLAVDGGTRVELTHSGWEAFGDAATAARRAYSGPDAWGHVLDHYADLADRLEPAPAAVAALGEAYEAFFAEALRGGFAAPAAGEWTAQRVLAHVAVHDDALAAVCRSLIQGGGGEVGTDDAAAPTSAGGPPSEAGAAGPRVPFSNATSGDAAVLDAHVQRHGGDLQALVATGRARARQVLDLLARLDEDALATPVAARLVDAGEVALDATLPWSRLVLTVQPQRHLPAHTEQLRALRAGTPSPGDRDGGRVIGVPPAGLEPALERF